MRRSLYRLVLLLALAALPLGAETDFRCVVCSRTVSQGYQVEGRFYCPAHLDEALPKCRHCKSVIKGNYVAVTEKNYPVCLVCRALPRCFLCTMPADTPGGGRELADGRRLCPDHTRSGVVDEKTARSVFAGAVLDIEQVFAGTLALRTPLKEVRLVDLDGLKRAASKNGTHSAELKSGRVLGLATITWVVERGERHMQPSVVSLLDHVPPERMVAVAVHEYAHVWHAENNPQYPQTTTIFREGFAEWVTFKVSQALSRHEQTTLMRNPSGGDYYTGLMKFLELERRRGVRGVLNYATHATNI